MEIAKKEKLSVFQKFLTLALVFVIGGIFGFIYEEFFYRIDLGYWTKRGSTFGPWIPIYGIGAILIVLTTHRLRHKPFMVFVISAAVCGLLEYITGYVLFRFLDLRLWNYNTEIWNWGDLNGYICIRSVLFFGLSALFLQYILLPKFKAIALKCNTGPRCFVALIPLIMFLADIIAYGLISLK